MRADMFQRGRAEAGFARFHQPSAGLVECITWVMSRQRWNNDQDWVAGFYSVFEGE